MLADKFLSGRLVGQQISQCEHSISQHEFIKFGTRDDLEEPEPHADTVFISDQKVKGEGHG